ncbi:hypothetical protein Tco_1096392, partial [Tanacetum coccineum]
TTYVYEVDEQYDCIVSPNTTTDMEDDTDDEDESEDTNVEEDKDDEDESDDGGSEVIDYVWRFLLVIFSQM